MDRIWQKHYGTIPAEVDATAQGTIVDLLENAVAEFGDKAAFHALYTNLRYSEIDRLSRDFAAYLQTKLSLAKGARVAVMMPNLLSFPVVSFGIIRAGLVQVNVNPLYSPRELAHQLNDAGCDTIVIFSMATATLEAIIDQTGIKNIISVGLDDLNGLQMANPPVVESLRARAVPLLRCLLEGKQMPFNKPVVTQDDLIFLQYTGGTTGLSKGAMLTHGNLASNVAMFVEWTKDHVVRGEEVVVTALPLYHIFALMVNFLSYFKIGATNVLIPNPRDMEAFVKEWSKWRVTAFTGVNTLFVGLMHTPGFASQDFSKLRVCMGGGAPVQNAVSARWKSITGQHITEGYGLSETSPILTANPLSLTEAIGSIGIPFPSTDISIRDDDGKEVAMGAAGELCAKGPQVMRGYWQNDTANAECFTPDGYFKTGDIATVDAEGYFRIVDRKKDMILVSGFNVFPNEIEDVIAHLDGVMESACVGVPDDKTGEAVKVFVVRSKDSVTEDDIIAHCRKELAAYKVPRQIVFKAELPKSTVGKILRRELRDA